MTTAVADRDLLEVFVEQDIMNDRLHLRLRSRHFQDWRAGIAFNAFEAPPEREAINVVLAAFTPLFRAYAGMPFGTRITAPLLAATMDRLLPEIHRRLVELGNYYGPRTRQRLIPAHPIVENAFIQGEVARQHMDRIEAAFRTARESGDLVSLSNAQVVPRPEDLQFLDPESFRTGRQRQQVRTATEAQIMREMEQAFFYGRGVRLGDFWDTEVLARAKETLVHCLNEVQRAEFAREGRFTVAAPNGRLYRVLTKDTFNVEDDSWLYCCTPAEEVCIYDKMLASKLWLEAEYERFMRIANRKCKQTGRVIFGCEESDIFQRGRMLMWHEEPLRAINPARVARLFTGA